MKLFTIKNVATGTIIWEGIEFSSGPVAMCTVGTLGLADIKQFDSALSMSHKIVIPSGYCLAWTEPIPTDVIPETFHPWIPK